MEIKYLKTGESIEMALAEYGYTIKDLARKVYVHDLEKIAQKKLRNRISNWLKAAMIDLKYNKEETVWDHYAKNCNEKKNSDRLLPEYYVQRWYMEIHRKKFIDLINRIEPLPDSLKKTKEEYELRKKVLLNSNGDMSFEDFDDNSSEPDFAAEAQRASEEGARQEIERQKELLLKDYIWEKFQLEKGVIFGEDQERIFIRDFCLRDDLIGSEDFGVMYQELDKKLADIENYFEKQRKKRL